DAALAETGIDKNAHPRALQDKAGVVLEVALQPVRHRLRAIGQPLLPLRVPAAHEHLFIDAVDKRFLGREIAIEQRLRDTKLAREIARTRVKSVAGIEADRRLDDLVLARFRAETLARLDSLSRCLIV